MILCGLGQEFDPLVGGVLFVPVGAKIGYNTGTGRIGTVTTKQIVANIQNLVAAESQAEARGLPAGAFMAALKGQEPEQAKAKDYGTIALIGLAVVTVLARLLWR